MIPAKKTAFDLGKAVALRHGLDIEECLSQWWGHAPITATAQQVLIEWEATSFQCAAPILEEYFCIPAQLIYKIRQAQYQSR